MCRAILDLGTGPRASGPGPRVSGPGPRASVTFSSRAENGFLFRILKEPPPPTSSNLAKGGSSSGSFVKLQIKVILLTVKGATVDRSGWFF